MPTLTRTPPAVDDLESALVAIACVVRSGDPLRRLPEVDRVKLRRRIVAGIVNLEALLAMLTETSR